MALNWFKKLRGLYKRNQVIRFLADNYAFPQVVFDEKGEVEFYNKAFLDLTGTILTTLKKINIKSFIFNDDTTLFNSAINNISATNAPYTIKLRIKHHNTGFQATSVVLSILFVQNNCKHFRLEIINSPEEAETQEAKAEAFLDLNKLFVNSMDMLCIADTDGHFCMLNPEWERTLGYTLAELMGKRFIEFVHPDDVQETIGATKQLAENEAVLNFVNRYRHKNGTYKWIEWRSYPDKNLIYAAARDITQKKATEEALKDNEQKYRTLFENMTSGFALHEMEYDNKGIPVDFRFLEINKQFKELWSLTDEAIGKKFLEIFPHTEKKWLTTIDNIIKTRGSDNQIFQFPDGRYIETLIFWIEGNKFAGIFTDVSHRITAQHKLKTSEEQFRGIAQNIPGMVFQFSTLKDKKYDLKYVSDLSQKYFGLDNKLLDGFFERFISGIVVEDRQKFIDSVEESIETLQPWSFEGRYKKPDDGGELYFRGVAQSRKLENEIVFDGILLDITKSKLADLELAKTKAILTTALMQTPIPMVIVSAPDNVIRMSNKACAEILGVDDENAFNEKSLMKLNPEWQDFDEKGNAVPLNEAPLAKALQGIETKNKEFYIKRKDSTIRWISVNASTIRDNSGNIIGAYLVFPDLTERKNSEEALKKSEKLLSESQRIAQIGCWELEINTNILIWNEEAFQIFGFNYNEIAPTFEKLIEIVHPDDRANLTAHYQETLDTLIFKDISYRIFLRDGSVKYINNVGALSLDERGIPFRMFGIVQDITQRKMAEEALVESEAKARLFIENTPLPIAMFDTEMRYIMASKRWSIDYKLGDQQIIGRSHYDVFPEISDQWKNDHQRVLKGEVYKNDEDKFVREDGSVQWLRYELHPWRKSDGKIGGLVMFTEDITRQKEAIEVIRRNEARLIKAQELGRFGYSEQVIGDPWLWASAEGKRIYGFEPVNGLVHIDTIKACIPNSELLRKSSEDLINSGKKYDIQFVINPADGSPQRNIHAIQEVEFNETGVPYKLISIFQDVTEQAKAESENRKLLMATEQSPSHIIINDINGFIEYVNTRFTEVTGYTPDEVIGKNITDFFPEIYEQENVPEFLKEGKSWQGEVLSFKKDNTTFWENVSISPLRDDNNVITHFVLVKEDITQRKLMEQQLIEARDNAEQSDRLKDAFLKNLSHEIRTPLNAIVGFSELLHDLKEFDKETFEKYSSIIVTNSYQLLTIVSDILTIARIETGQEILNWKSVEINELVDTLYETFLPKTKEKNFLFTLEKSIPDAHFFTKTDTTKLAQILTNLLSNAFKFTQTGFIIFGYKISDNNLIFYVLDSGIGIKKDAQKHIFERFRQADFSISINYGGAGLGLSISKSYADMLGGKLWVESEPGEGSAFYFSIPIVSREQEHPMNTSEKKINLPEENFTFLVAEDEAYNYILLKALLENEKIKLIHVTDGLEAVKKCKENPNIDLILMDIKMPVMDGIKAFDEIRKFNPSIPVIAQTAYALEHEKQMLLDKGFNNYISKPIKKAALFSVIKNTLARV